MTRSQGDLIVCVSERCYQRLSTERKAFVDSFQCMTVDEYIKSLTAAQWTSVQSEIIVSADSDEGSHVQARQARIGERRRSD